MAYVLFLPKWYPNPLKLLNGDFVQRHAEALATQTAVAVVHLYADPSVRGGIRWTDAVVRGVRTVQGAYPSRLTGVPALDRPLKAMLYFYGAARACRRLRRQRGRPAVVHVHVLLRPGLLGWALARRYRRPLFVTEHWSGYYAADGGYARLPAARRWLSRQVVRRAAAVLPVSERLAAALRGHGFRAPMRVVPNVVDTDRFALGLSPSVPTLLHVSTLLPVKNVEGLLRTVARLFAERPNVRLEVVGGTPDRRAALAAYADSLGLDAARVHFLGELTGDNLVAAYHRATGVVLFSHYETFGCVLIEALASGRPVVATRAGAMPEIVSDAVGQLVPPGDEDALLGALRDLLDRAASYSPARLRTYAVGRYGYVPVGKQLMAVYRTLGESDVG